MLSVPNKVRPGMSSTVNIITEIIKSTISIPIQSLTSRPENYKELELNEEKSDENEDDILFKKNKPIDVVFVLVDTFEGEKVPEGKKYALVRPIKVGTSSENFYAIKSGIEVSEIIVTGGYRVLSKELNHGDIVTMNSTLKVQN